MEDYERLAIVFHMPGIQYVSSKYMKSERIPSVATKAAVLMGLTKKIPLNYMCCSTSSHHAYHWIDSLYGKNGQKETTRVILCKTYKKMLWTLQLFQETAEADAVVTRIADQLPLLPFILTYCEVTNSIWTRFSTGCVFTSPLL